MRREDWDARYAAVENLWARRPNRFLVAETQSLPPGRALDLACGEGQNSIWLASLGWEVTGVDFSPVAIEKARSRAAQEGSGAEFLCAELVDFRPVAGGFDLAIVLYLHIAKSERCLVLERAAEALSPGGTFLLVGHALDNLEHGVGGPRDPELLCTPDEIAAELPGLEIEKAEHVLRDVDDADRPAIDVLVRARRPGA